MPITTETPTSNLPTITTYQGCESVEKDGIIYVHISDGKTIFNYEVKYNAPVITLYNEEKEITFDKYDINYCVNDHGKTYVKLTVLEQMGE
jgi:hypothetical protein